MTQAILVIAGFAVIVLALRSAKAALLALLLCTTLLPNASVGSLQVRIELILMPVLLAVVLLKSGEVRLCRIREQVVPAQLRHL